MAKSENSISDFRKTIRLRNMNNYEMVNHPSHYNKYDIEAIEILRRVFGTAATALWCEMTAFKYRLRLGEKPETPIEQDLKKEDWYLNKAKEYKNQLEADSGCTAIKPYSLDEIPEC